MLPPCWLDSRAHACGAAPADTGRFRSHARGTTRLLPTGRCRCRTRAYGPAHVAGRLLRDAIEDLKTYPVYMPGRDRPATGEDSDGRTAAPHETADAADRGRLVVRPASGSSSTRCAAHVRIEGHRHGARPGRHEERGVGPYPDGTISALRWCRPRTRGARLRQRSACHLLHLPDNTPVPGRRSLPSRTPSATGSAGVIPHRACAPGEAPSSWAAPSFVAVSGLRGPLGERSCPPTVEVDDRDGPGRLRRRELRGGPWRAGTAASSIRRRSPI